MSVRTYCIWQANWDDVHKAQLLTHCSSSSRCTLRLSDAGKRTHSGLEQEWLVRKVHTLQMPPSSRHLQPQQHVSAPTTLGTECNSQQRKGKTVFKAISDMVQTSIWASLLGSKSLCHWLHPGWALGKEPSGSPSLSHNNLQTLVFDFLPLTVCIPLEPIWTLQHSSQKSSSLLYTKTITAGDAWYFLSL